MDPTGAPTATHCSHRPMALQWSLTAACMTCMQTSYLQFWMASARLSAMQLKIPRALLDLEAYNAASCISVPLW